MGFIQPTTYALINVTDFPFFVVPLNEIEHVHFERVFSSSKTCDMKIIMKVIWEVADHDEDRSRPARVNRIKNSRFIACQSAINLLWHVWRLVFWARSVYQDWIRRGGAQSVVLAYTLLQR